MTVVTNAKGKYEQKWKRQGKQNQVRLVHRPPDSDPSCYRRDIEKADLAYTQYTNRVLILKSRIVPTYTFMSHAAFNVLVKLTDQVQKGCNKRGRVLEYTSDQRYDPEKLSQFGAYKKYKLVYFSPSSYSSEVYIIHHYHYTLRGWVPREALEWLTTVEDTYTHEKLRAPDFTVEALHGTKMEEWGRISCVFVGIGILAVGAATLVALFSVR